MLNENEKGKTKEYVLKATREKDVKSISLWFTDILGFLKSFDIQPTGSYWQAYPY